MTIDDVSWSYFPIVRPILFYILYRNKHCLQRFLFISGYIALDRVLPKNWVKSFQLQWDENYEFVAIILSNKIDFN